MKFYDNFLHKEALEISDLKRVFDVLDFLGAQSWKVNKTIFKIIEEIWEEGGGKAKIPFKYEKDSQNSTKSSTFDFHVKEQQD